MNIAFAGGKTGGHIFPGVALAQVLQERGHKVVFFSPYNKLDQEILKNHQIPFCFIHSAAPAGFSFFFNLFLGFFQAFYYLLINRTQIVVGLGGFPSVPSILAAVVLRKKIILLEQNIMIGRANLFLARFAKYICVSFKETIEKNKGLSKKLILTGNPMRKNIREAKKKNRKDLALEFGLNQEKPIVLVVGGSQGAKIINDVIMKCVFNSDIEIQWIHITGKDQYEQIKKIYDQENKKVLCLPFSNQMGELMVMSDLVITRAGASTIAELLYLEKPAILIPFKKAKDSHQDDNAKILENQKMAVVIEEDHLALELMKQKMNEMLNKKNDFVKQEQIKEAHEKIIELMLNQS